MLKDKCLTYISLFSSAGVGCYGFKQEGFECIATNEIIERRLNVQKYNRKCFFDTGYICDDITTTETKEKIFNEIKKWKKLGNDRVDVVIATPPCQGMSVANHKKADNEIVRNSLVVESIQIIQSIYPRFFVFENVPAFMKTGCTAPDGTIKAIADVIDEELGDRYAITSRIINFKNYGSNSSRTRTVVIGVSREYMEYIAPIELFPYYVEEKKLRSIIGDMPTLEWGEICSTDFYHAFRTYPVEMREWIHDLKEGESAFDNTDPNKRPHKVENGVIVPNIQKNGDKYTRQYWDKVAPCIHTRNDQLASQNTVHPVEDRVFSIRELMRIMTIPDKFRWIDMSLDELNSLPINEKYQLLKKEEIKIRQSIGEAVPTRVFEQIAHNIRVFMQQDHLKTSGITQAIKDYDLENSDNLVGFLNNNPINADVATLARIAELTNSKRENNAAYYTNKFIVNEIFNELPLFDKDEIRILEPSVGVGNFIPLLFRKYESVKTVHLDVIDIDERNLEVLKCLLEKQRIPNNFSIEFICADALTYDYGYHYDLVVGNPPFMKFTVKEASKYRVNNYNCETTNASEFFLEKAISIADYVSMIMPKAILNTPEFSLTREMLSRLRVDCIQDFGENGFKGVLVETICIFINTIEKPAKTKIQSLTLQLSIVQNQSYIMDNTYPYWIIYRNSFFDEIANRLRFDVFTVFRDRQITNSNTAHAKKEGSIRVLKSRNISDDGSKIIDIPGYDSYIENDIAEHFNAYKYVNDRTVYITPNMTYNPRVMKNPENIIVNGSVAILIPKGDIRLSDNQLKYFSSEEYRKFYRIARNFQTRSLNVDSTSVFFYGILKED